MVIFTKTCSAKSANMEMYLYLHIYIYISPIDIYIYIYNLATHLNLELTHHNCVGFTGIMVSKGNDYPQMLGI